MRVNAGPGYVPSITKALSYGWSNGFSEQWLPESTPGPHDTGGGNQIQVEGNFPGGCNYAFQDDLGQSLKVVKIETGRHVNEENEDGGVVRDLPDRAILQLPDDPRSTSVKEVTGPFGTSTKITLRTFRNTWGFNGVNSGEGAGTTDFSWSDFLRTFGSDDGDACVPILGCVRDPVALIAWHFISNKIEGQKGICFGWATMALRFERGIERPTDYQQGARYSYDICNPEKEGPAIKSAAHPLAGRPAGHGLAGVQGQPQGPTRRRFRSSTTSCVTRCAPTTPSRWRCTRATAVTPSTPTT